MNHSYRWQCSLCMLVVLSLISACDGGLFGTGDGGTVIDAENTAGLEPPTGGDMGSAPDSVDNQDNTIQQAFENLLIGGVQDIPLLTAINLSTRQITVSAQTSDGSLPDTALQPEENSGTLSMAPGENTLTIKDTQTAATLFTISPLNLGTSSLTTVIVREIQGVPDIVLLRSSSDSGDPAVALLRIVLLNPLDEGDEPATLILRPAGSNPGDSEVGFPDSAASTASQVQYSTVNPGDYEVIDPLNRMQPTLVSIDAGRAYTLLIRDNAILSLLEGIGSEGLQ